LAQSPRKTCFEIIFKINQKSKDFVNQSIKKLYQELGDQATNLFQTITYE